MTKEGSNKIVNFMTHGAMVLVLGCGHKNHISKYALSFLFITICNTLIDFY